MTRLIAPPRDPATLGRRAHPTRCRSLSSCLAEVEDEDLRRRLAGEPDGVRTAHCRPVAFPESLAVQRDRSTRDVDPRVPAGGEVERALLTVLDQGQPETDVLADAQAALAAVAGREQGEAAPRRLPIDGLLRIGRSQPQSVRPRSSARSTCVATPPREAVLPMATSSPIITTVRRQWARRRMIAPPPAIRRRAPDRGSRRPRAGRAESRRGRSRPGRAAAAPPGPRSRRRGRSCSGRWPAAPPPGTRPPRALAVAPSRRASSGPPAPAIPRPVRWKRSPRTGSAPAATAPGPPRSRA